MDETETLTAPPSELAAALNPSLEDVAEGSALPMLAKPDTTAALVADAAHGFMPVPMEVIDAVAKRLAKAAVAIRPAFAENEAGCWAVAYQASRWGLDPVFALSKAYIATSGTKGGIAYEAQLIHALINRFAPIRGGITFEYGYGGDGKKTAGNLFCVASVIDSRTGEVKSVKSPTVAQVRVKNSPLWVSHPELQLGYYTGRALARLHYPEVLAGAYSVDELQQIVVTDLTAPRPRALFEDDDEPQAPQDAEFTPQEPQERPPAPAATTPPPEGAEEPDGLQEAREWAASEQARLLALTDAAELQTGWQAFSRDKRFGRLRAYDQGVANAIRASIIDRGNALLAAKGEE